MIMDSKRTLLLMLMPLMAVVALAQRSITGMVVDDAQDPIPQTTVKLLKTDSTLVKGALTDMEGKFKIASPQAGEYILQITCVGFKAYTKRVKVADKDVALGTIDMEPDAVMLKGATITGQALTAMSLAGTLGLMMWGARLRMMALGVVMWTLMAMPTVLQAEIS
jgi:hypothetical protein